MERALLPQKNWVILEGFRRTAAAGSRLPLLYLRTAGRDLVPCDVSNDRLRKNLMSHDATPARFNPAPFTRRRSVGFRGGYPGGVQGGGVEISILARMGDADRGGLSIGEEAS